MLLFTTSECVGVLLEDSPSAGGFYSASAAVIASFELSTAVLTATNFCLFMFVDGWLEGLKVSASLFQFSVQCCHGYSPVCSDAEAVF